MYFILGIYERIRDLIFGFLFFFSLLRFLDFFKLLIPMRKGQSVFFFLATRLIDSVCFLLFFFIGLTLSEERSILKLAIYTKQRKSNEVGHGPIAKGEK